MIALETIDLPEAWGFVKEQGKVRDVFRVREDTLLLGATDRLSAFDRQVGLIPNRGEVLTKLSAWWFERTADIIPNHMLDIVDPNVMAVRKYPRVDLELIVRAYNTGSTSTSIWRRYQQGQRQFGTVTLPDGMEKNTPLPQPILDPTTKAAIGHDTAITRQAIIDAGIVGEDEYEALEDLALRLFARGQELARQGNLILVDTKYEFGRDPETGNFVLIDEIHTPDSSRFWAADTYDEKRRRGQEPDNYDKEYARLWFTSQGYRGDGEPPVMPPNVIQEIRQRYIESYERLVGSPFQPSSGNRQQEVIANVENWVRNCL